MKTRTKVHLMSANGATSISAMRRSASISSLWDISSRLQTSLPCRWVCEVLVDIQLTLLSGIMCLWVTLLFKVSAHPNTTDETVSLGYSEFCHLFTKEEWEGGCSL